MPTIWRDLEPISSTTLLHDLFSIIHFNIILPCFSLSLSSPFFRMSPNQNSAYIPVFFTTLGDVYKFISDFSSHQNRDLESENLQSLHPYLAT